MVHTPCLPDLHWGDNLKEFGTCWSFQTDRAYDSACMLKTDLLDWEPQSKTKTWHILFSDLHLANSGNREKKTTPKTLQINTNQQVLTSVFWTPCHISDRPVQLLGCRLLASSARCFQWSLCRTASPTCPAGQSCRWTGPDHFPTCRSSPSLGKPGYPGLGWLEEVSRVYLAAAVPSVWRPCPRDNKNCSNNNKSVETI